MAENNKTYVKQYDLYTDLIKYTDITIFGVCVLCKVVQFQESGNFCYISNETFAETWGTSVSTIKRQIKILVNNGLLISKSTYSSTHAGKTRLLSVPKNLDSKVKSIININRSILEKQQKQEDINNSQNSPIWVHSEHIWGHPDLVIYNKENNNNNINMAQKMDTDQKNHTDQKTNNFLKTNNSSDNSINFQDNFSDNSNQMIKMITSYHNSNIESNKLKYDLSEDTDEVKTGESDQMSTSCHKLSLMKDFWNNLNIIRKYQYVIDNSKDTALYMAWVDKDNPKNNEEYTEEEINEMLEEIDNKKLIEELRKPIL
nr:MAG TPA: helix-turn-helix domain protein [Bacteriophage sp.]